MVEKPMADRAAVARLGRYAPVAAQHAVWAAAGTAQFEYRPAAPEQLQAQVAQPATGETGTETPPCKARMNLVLSHKCERPLLHYCGAKATAAVLTCDRWPCVRPTRSTATFLVLVPAEAPDASSTKAEARKPPAKIWPMFAGDEGGRGRRPTPPTKGPIAAPRAL